MAGGQAASDKWKKRVGESRAYLDAAIPGGQQKYDSNIGGAEDSYQEGLRKSMADNRYSQATAGKGARWGQKMKEKGIDRWVDGVAKGQPDYLKGAGSNIDAMQNYDYGPMGARGSQAQMDRQRKAVEFARSLRKYK
jgi:hypothetical protein